MNTLDISIYIGGYIIAQLMIHHGVTLIIGQKY